jgi:hypothetical protein
MRQILVFGKAVEDRILRDKMENIARIESKPLLDDLPERVGGRIESPDFVNHLLDAFA